MNATKLLLATVVGFVVIFVLSGLWHSLIMGDFYADQAAAVSRPEMNMGMVIVGNVILALLMSYMFPMGYKGGAAVGEGLRFGVLVGLLWTLPLELIFVGVWNVPLTLALVDSGWHVVEEGLAGIAIAMVYARGGSKE